MPSMMTLLDERPSGKLCVSYQKSMAINAVDEITAELHRLTSMDSAKVSCQRWGYNTHDEAVYAMH